jgi:hypothetical protein
MPLGNNDLRDFGSKLFRCLDTLVRSGAGDPRLEMAVAPWVLLEVARSKALITELGCEHLLRWVLPMHKRELWKAFLEANCVVNQFRVPGLAGPISMR